MKIMRNYCMLCRLSIVQPLLGRVWGKYVLLIAFTAMTSCQLLEKKEAKDTVTTFMEALKSNDVISMESTYPRLLCNDVRHILKTDKFEITDIEYMDKYHILVRGNNYYMNPFGKLYTEPITFSVGRDTIGKSGWTSIKYSGWNRDGGKEEIAEDRFIIYDSYNLIQVDDDKLYQAGIRIITEKQSDTDCEKLEIINDTESTIDYNASFICKFINSCFSFPNKNINYNWGTWYGSFIITYHGLIDLDTVNYEFYGVNNGQEYLVGKGVASYDGMSRGESEEVPVAFNGGYYDHWRVRLKISEETVKNAILKYYLTDKNPERFVYMKMANQTRN